MRACCLQLEPTSAPNFTGTVSLQKQIPHTSYIHLRTGFETTLVYDLIPSQWTFFFLLSNKTISKQNLVQSTTVWFFTYNLANVSIFQSYHFFTDDISLVRQRKIKSNLDQLAPCHFHSAREHWDQVGCTFKKKKHIYTTIPRITQQFPLHA